MEWIIEEINSRIDSYKENIKELEHREKNEPFKEWIRPEITETNLLISELESLKYFIEKK